MAIEVIIEEQDKAARMIGMAIRGLIPFARDVDLAMIEYLLEMVLVETDRVERGVSTGAAH